MRVVANHTAIPDTGATRRYFAKFDRIISYLRSVVTQAPYGKGPFADTYQSVIEARLVELSWTFRALSYKHLVAKHVSNALPHQLEIDRRDSGFPVYRELVQMANDAIQAEKHLDALPSAKILKREMVEHILRERTPPRRLQFALSQRLYYEMIDSGAVFLAQNHPEIIYLRTETNSRPRYLVHWAVYDSQANRPDLYLMEVEDSGSTPLPRDERRWPRAQSHLLAQSLNSLKLVTIASGFDKDFEDLHPKRLTRIHVGPMYSHTFTEQDGPLHDVLAETDAEPGSDWIMAWTIEVLVSRKAEKRSAGIFNTVDQELYALDSFAKHEKDTGASRVDRALILPQKHFQVLSDKDYPSLRGVPKFVVGAGDQVLMHS